MSLVVRIKKKYEHFCLNADFTSEDGVLCLLGGSGSGKSVTLKCIAGLITPDEGYIELDGTVFYDSSKGINLSPQERRVGYLLQNYALFPNMTVKQNLLCAMRIEDGETKKWFGIRKGKDQPAKEAKVAEMLAFLQMSGFEDRFPHQLSGGQMQRIALGRILLNKPRLLLLDEPFSALDYYLKDSLIPEMKRMLHNFPHGVIMVTHNREEAYRLADMATVIDQGNVLPVRPLKKLFANPETVGAALVTGCKNIATARKIGEYEVYVPDWDVALTTAKPVPDDIKAIGMRAHYFHKNTLANQHEVEFVEVIEEPFELIILFRYRGQKEETPSLWWRMPKDERPQIFPERLGIAPANIMPLR